MDFFQNLLAKCAVESRRDITEALVFSIDVLQVEAFVTLADVAAKSVDAFPEPGAHRNPCCTLIHICSTRGR